MRPTSRFAALLCVAPMACGGRHGAARGEEVVVRGSDTMVVLAQRWAAAYQRERPGVALQVSGGGSGTGIAALENGTADLATASRAMTDEEHERIRRARGAGVEATRVCVDAITVYVHPSNPIGALSLPQLAALFRGRVRRWSAFGGPDRPVVLYSRESSSGTYAYFKERVLERADFAAEVQSLPGSAAVVDAVAHDPGGVGYGGVVRASGVRVVPLLPPGGGAALPPTAEGVANGSYPLARPLFVYRVGGRGGEPERFARWLDTPLVRELALGAGFYPAVGAP